MAHWANDGLETVAILDSSGVSTLRTDIDVTFDFRQDTPAGKDPDAYSKTLRRYHKMLWSKPLPSGLFFELTDTVRGHYLHHKSTIGEFSLSSDAVIPSFKWNKQIQSFIPTEELNIFCAAGYTIGGMMLFPAKQVDRNWTINQARGFRRQIRDRFDLTLECIRRHYTNDTSPLSDVLMRYASFFELFGDFRGYVDFFLLNDLVSADASVVKISPPFDNFRGPVIPTNSDEYRSYESDALRFIRARNERILKAAWYQQ